MLNSSTSHFKNDLLAGFSVFLVALPLCLGIALASGAPLFAGILAGIVGGIIVGALSGSEVSVSGPAAGLTVIVLDSIATLGSYQNFLTAVMLAGLLQLLMGIFKAGRLSSFVPSSVITGMLVAIGIVIILKQIPHALGWDADFEGEFEFFQNDQQNTFSEIGEALTYFSMGAIVISASALLLIVGWERAAKSGLSFFKTVPSGLGVVAIGVGFNELFRIFMPEWYLGNSPAHMVSVPTLSNMSELSTAFNLPSFAALNNPKIYTVAATIAIVASIESLLSLEAADKLDPQRRMSSPNQELRAQGIGNMISGLIGGLPVTSVVVRTTANIYSGAKTRFSSIFHGVLLVIAVLAIPSFLNRIPLACLAALLLSVGYKLAKVDVFKRMYREGQNQFVPFIVTVIAIIFTDLLIGVLIGLVVGIVYVVYRNNRSSFSVVREKDTTLILMKEDVSFLNKASLKDLLMSFQPGDIVFIDGSRAQFIEYDIYATIRDFEADAAFRNIDVQTKGIQKYKTFLKRRNGNIQKTVVS